MVDKSFIGKFVGASVYLDNNKVMLDFLNEKDARNFLNIIIGSQITPSVGDLMVERREKDE